MSFNYDTSKVGVPYVRTRQLIIDWPDNNQTPKATIVQGTAVRLADGTVRVLGDQLPQINVDLDFAAAGDEAVALVDPEHRQPTGGFTSLNQAFFVVLALVHKYQTEANEAALSNNV